MTNAFYVALTFKLRTMGSKERAERHKLDYGSPWDHLGVADEDLDKAVKTVVGAANVDLLLPFSERLWNEPIWEFKIAGLRALTLDHVEATDGLWDFVKACVPQLDGIAISDQLAPLAAKCLAADTGRLDDMEAWIAGRHKWTRRAALAFTRPLSGMEPEASRVTAWATDLQDDKEQVVKDAASIWLA